MDSGFGCRYSAPPHDPRLTWCHGSDRLAIGGCEGGIIDGYMPAAVLL